MMQRPLVDINVLMDVLTERRQFFEEAARFWTAVESADPRAVVSADSFSTIFYLLSRHQSREAALRGLHAVQAAFEIVPLTEQVIRDALDSPIRDFEDAVQYHSALVGGADCIVTRDKRDFRGGDLPILSPGEFLASR